MKDLFPNFYRYTEDEFKALWKDCKFILDTNVLTHLYLYSKETREDLLEIFSKISDRLWIPYQVALEFQENRINAIAGQKKELSKIKDVYSKIEPTLIRAIDDLQLRKSRLPVDGDQLIKDIKAVFEKVSEQVSTKEKEYPEFTGEDTLRDIIDNLFRNKIGSPPETQIDLEKIYKEGELRYKWNRPPGYEDSRKVGAYWQNGLYYIQAYGDLIIWKQIITQAQKDTSFQKIIFITDDEKEDWWWKEGGKFLGPKPELIDEIYSEAKAMFYMYSVNQFLKYAKDFLGIESKPDTVKEINDINQIDNRTKKYGLGARFLSNFDAFNATYSWLLPRHQHGSFVPHTSSGQFVVEEKNGIKIIYQVIYNTDPLFEIKNYAEFYNKKCPQDADLLKLLVIVDSEDEVNQLNQSTKLLQPDLPKHISIGIGLLEIGVGERDPYFKYVMPSEF